MMPFQRSGPNAQLVICLPAISGASTAGSTVGISTVNRSPATSITSANAVHRSIDAVRLLCSNVRFSSVNSRRYC